MKPGPCRTVALTVGVALAVAACGAGPSSRPPLAVGDNRLAAPPAAPGSATPSPSPVPPLQAPTTELGWAPCPTDAGPDQPPGGVLLDCATVPAQLDRSLRGSVRLGLQRARTAATPSDAAPFVLLSGAKEPATARLVRWVSGARADLVADHPIIALDRRGTGSSEPLDCQEPAYRAMLVDLDAGAPGDQQGAALALGRQWTLACTDVLRPAELAFDGQHAAADVERLRQALGLDTMAVIGSGSGAAIALRDAVNHPGRLSRLVLDSTVMPDGDLAAAAHQEALGAEAAFDAFVRACEAAGCPVPDPRASVLALQARARTQALPAGRHASVSAGAVLLAVRQALRAPGPGGGAGSGPGLGQALADAGGGDASALAELAETAVADRSGGERLGVGSTTLDAEFITRCSDAAIRPTAAQVAELTPRWAAEAPLFGADAALRMLLCLPWSTPPAPPAATGLADLPPVLVLGSTDDPVAGPDTAPDTVQLLEGAGARATLLRQQGSTHPVLGNSGCVSDAVGRYLTDGTLPQPQTLCPP